MNAFITPLLECYFSPMNSAQPFPTGGGVGGWGGMITFGPCSSFHGSIGVSADPGPVESWEDVQTSGLLNCVSTPGVSRIHFDGALCWPKAARVLKVKNFHPGEPRCLKSQVVQGSWNSIG